MLLLAFVAINLLQNVYESANKQIYLTCTLIAYHSTIIGLSFYYIPTQRRKNKKLPQATSLSPCGVDFVKVNTAYGRLGWGQLAVFTYCSCKQKQTDD